MHIRQEFVLISLQIGILFFPIAFSIVRYLRLTGTESETASSWLNYAPLHHAISLGALITWCAFADANSNSIFPFAYWILPVSAGLVLQLITRLISRSVLERRWTAKDLIRLSSWSTVHPVLTLLMITTGFQDIFVRNLWGLCWLATAGVIAIVGTARLRSAQGIRLRRVKSGTLYVRAMHLAKMMGVQLKRVYVVPPGRGNLTNAFATSRSVALTDNFGEYLHGPQLDWVIAHELAHTKRKHTRTTVVVILFLFSALILLSFAFAGLVPHLWWLLKMMILSGALLTIYGVSRRFEYEADRDSALFTGNAEAAMRALAALYRKTGTPMERNRFLELFMTHPGLSRRAFAIARLGRIPDSRAAEILSGTRISADVLLPSR